MISRTTVSGAKRRSWRILWQSKNKSNGIFPAHSLLAVPPRQTVQTVTSILYHPTFSSSHCVGIFTSKGRNQHTKKNYSQRNTLPSSSPSMTLSSTSRQQRKSMLPKLRPSSRISTRRVASGDTTSRIARRVPSPLLAVSCNNGSIITTQAVRAAVDGSLPLPEAGLRRAGSPSMTGRSGQIHTSSDLRPRSDRSEASSSLMSRTPSPIPEVKKRGGVNIQYPTPLASSEIRYERFFKGQETRGLDAQPSPSPLLKIRVQHS